MNTDRPYGQEDATYQAAGGEEGIRNLVDTFYDLMASRLEYQKIHRWHPDDATARDKLWRFLSGWMGGPRRYSEKYGPLNIPRAHAHLPVTEKERDMWLNCMRDALARQPYPEDFKEYLIKQLSVPAEAVKLAATKRQISDERD